MRTCAKTFALVANGVIYLPVGFLNFSELGSTITWNGKTMNLCDLLAKFDGKLVKIKIAEFNVCQVCYETEARHTCEKCGKPLCRNCAEDRVVFRGWEFFCPPCFKIVESGS